MNEQRDPQTGEWGEPVVGIWNARYFLNGHGIQDQHWRDGSWTSNLRIYDPEQEQWRVTYLKMPGYASGEWTGRKEGDRLYQPTTTPAAGTRRVGRAADASCPRRYGCDEGSKVRSR